MASIDHCLRLLATDKDRLFREYERKLERFGEEIKDLKRLSVLCYGSEPSAHGFFAFDPGKLVIVTKNTSICGKTLMDTLRTEHKIELERAEAEYAIAMTSVCDSAEGFSRLAAALREIDATLVNS